MIQVPRHTSRALTSWALCYARKMEVSIPSRFHGHTAFETGLAPRQFIFQTPTQGRTSNAGEP